MSADQTTQPDPAEPDAPTSYQPEPAAQQDSPQDVDPDGDDES